MLYREPSSGTIRLAFVFFLAITAILAVSKRAPAMEIDGRQLVCENALVTIDNDIDNLGLTFIRPPHIFLNTQILSRYSPEVRRFVFLHECGHFHVGGNEIAADCWGLQQGLKEGSLTEQSLDLICKSWGNAPATDIYPSAKRRCENLNRCFKQFTEHNNDNDNNNKNNNGADKAKTSSAYAGH
jgi:hypothetical protein